MIWKILYEFCSLSVKEAGRKPVNLTARLGVPKERLRLCDAMEKDQDIIQGC
jgi:hypothetical protein